MVVVVLATAALLTFVIKDSIYPPPPLPLPHQWRYAPVSFKRFAHLWAVSAHLILATHSLALPKQFCEKKHLAR